MTKAPVIEKITLTIRLMEGGLLVLTSDEIYGLYLASRGDLNGLLSDVGPSIEVLTRLNKQESLIAEQWREEHGETS